ncbi:MAG: GDSL-type esterase/lipase family protein [bacterium]|nr:GDSL-type esterase/lipase family protein [bacterium]
MKKSRKQGKFLCIAIAGMLVLGDYTTCPAYASQLPSDDVCAESADGTEIIDITEPTDEQPAEYDGDSDLTGDPMTEIAELTDEQPAEYDGDSDLTDDPMTEIAELTDEQLAEYYGDSVFVGDSIMEGFRLYSVRQDSFVHDIQFLTAISYSVHNALRPVKGNIPHPEYQGKKYHVWDVLPLLGKKRVFILLGTNDLVSYGPEANRDKYKELIDKILEASPELEIHIVSVTYTAKGREKGCLYNPCIDLYNSLLQEMAEENGWGYIDLCTAISDGAGNLESSLSSDNFVHLKISAYALWEEELINYADAMLLETETEGGETDGAIDEATDGEIAGEIGGATDGETAGEEGGATDGETDEFTSGFPIWGSAAYDAGFAQPEELLSVQSGL